MGADALWSSVPGAERVCSEALGRATCFDRGLRGQYHSRLLSQALTMANTLRVILGYKNANQ